MTRFTKIILLSTIALGACCPGVYHKHNEGKVIGMDGQPIRGATIMLSVYKTCSNLGGRTSELEKSVFTKSRQDGRFNISATGLGFLYMYGLGGCGGFSTLLEVCSQGKWITGFSDNEPDYVKILDTAASGLILFNPKSGQDRPIAESATPDCSENTPGLEKRTN